MSPQKKTPSISDKQLRQALASLREEVAAPPDFRAKLMQRLEREGLLQAAPAVISAEPGFLTRLQVWLTPMRLSLAATVALALVLTLRFIPRAEAPATLGMSAVEQGTQSAVQAKPASVMAQAKPVHRQDLAPRVEVAQGPKTTSSPMPDAILDETQQSTQGAVGDDVAAAPVTSSQGAVTAADTSSSVPSTGAGVPVPGAGSMSIASVDPKPTVIVIEPSPTPVLNPLQGNSELRGNVIRASQGGSAVLLYHVFKAGRVHAEIFDRLGHSIAVLKDAEQSPGIYELKWGGQSDTGTMAPSGILVLDLSAPGYHVQHKLLLVK